MKWIDNTPPPPVKRIRKLGTKVKWKATDAERIMDKPNLYVIYGNEVGTEFDPNNYNYFWGIVKAGELKFAKFNEKKKKYEIRVSVLDRLNNESPVSKPVKIKL
jgi:coenzyme F420-reducing hydrogenase alpha subunit